MVFLLVLSELPLSSANIYHTFRLFETWEGQAADLLADQRLELRDAISYDEQQLLDPTTSMMSKGPALLQHKALLEPTNTPFRYAREKLPSVKCFSLSTTGWIF